MMDVGHMIELLRADVVPALGCTEPVCVAVCAATAADALAQARGAAVVPASIDVEVNPGLYKNGMSAGIPHCAGVGLDRAAALGAQLLVPANALEIFEGVTPQVAERAEAIVRAGRVSVRSNPAERSLYAQCVVRSAEGHEARCIIRDAHTNVVVVEVDGEAVARRRAPEAARAQGVPDLVAELSAMTIAEVRTLVDAAPIDDLAFLVDGVRMNERLAAYSENAEAGVGIARALREDAASSASLLSGGLLSRVILNVSSAAESRLDGCPLLTMSSSGAGTKGVAVMLPVSETARAIGAPRERELRAIAFAHLVNRYINAAIGKLSPMCTCVMASSTAAAAGIAYLLGGSDAQIGHAIRNMAGTVTGMICDGGKVGCALKVSTGSVAAVMAAVTAVRDAALRTSDGICAETPEQCIRNMARIGAEGMANVDSTIIDIMEEKKAR